MSVIVRGTEGITFPDSSVQSSAPQAVASDFAALQARLAAYDEMYKTRWDTRRVDSPACFAFSNNDLTATRTTIADSSYHSAISYPCGNAEKIYCEATIFIGNALAANLGIGVGKPWGTGPNNYAGVNTWTCGVFGSGNFYYNANPSAGYTTFGNGDTVALAIDAVAGVFWMRNVSTNSLWNNNAAADPSASPQVGGLTGYYNPCRMPCCIYFFSYTNGASCTLNCDGPFRGLVPAGYRRWRGRAP
jgi:hypothetical protein